MVFVEGIGPTPEEVEQRRVEQAIRARLTLRHVGDSGGPSDG